MNTQVIIIVAVLVLLILGAFFALKKEKYATQSTSIQLPNPSNYILASASTVLTQISFIKENTQLDYENALFIAAIYVYKNIDNINNYVAVYKAYQAVASSTNYNALIVASDNNLYVSSPFNKIRELSLQFGVNTDLAGISTTLFSIYLNMRLLDEENFSAISNTELYKSLLTIFPGFSSLPELKPKAPTYTPATTPAITRPPMPAAVNLSNIEQAQKYVKLYINNSPVSGYSVPYGTTVYTLRNISPFNIKSVTVNNTNTDGAGTWLYTVDSENKATSGWTTIYTQYYTMNVDLAPGDGLAVNMSQNSQGNTVFESITF